MIFSFLSQSAITARSVVVLGSVDGSVALPSAAQTMRGVIGVADNAIASGSYGDVITGGIARCNATGTITRGDAVVVADTAGTVVALALGQAVSVQGVGIAMESAVTGDVVSVMIKPFTVANGVVLPFVAGVGGTTASAGVIQSTATDLLVVIAGDVPTLAPQIGIALTTEIAGATVYVVTSGITGMTDSGSGWTRGQMITTSATGLGKTAAPAGGTNCGIIGIALESATASQTKKIFVRPFMMQG